MGLAPAELPSAAPIANGVGPRMPRHEHWLAIPEYPGFEVLGWTNFSQTTLLDLDSRDGQRVLPAMRALLRGCRTVTPAETYPYWFDCDGTPLPGADAEDFIDLVPTELLSMAVRVIRHEGPHRQGELFLARLIAERRRSG